MAGQGQNPGLGPPHHPSLISCAAGLGCVRVWEVRYARGFVVDETPLSGAGPGSPWVTLGHPGSGSLQAASRPGGKPSEGQGDVSRGRPALHEGNNS